MTRAARREKMLASLWICTTFTSKPSMSIAKAIALICTSSMLACVAQGGEPDSQWKESHFVDAEHCSLWVAWRGHQVYQGQGGSTLNNDGMEVWALGRPERKNRQLGYMIYYLPHGTSNKGYESCPDRSRDADAVQVANSMGGDAVIPLGRVGNELQFRVIKYLPESSDDTTPVTDEHVAPDFDNTKAEKEEGARVTVFKLPLAFAYQPPLNNYYPEMLPKNFTGGAAVIRICPDQEGHLSKPVEVVESSGFPALDQAALRWATDSRYKPRKNPLGGTPHVSCDKLQVDFKGRR
jgi:TonB family protein